MGRKSGKKNDEWREAKRRYPLSDEEVRMAKELGLNPRSPKHNFMKNAVSRVAAGLPQVPGFPQSQGDGP